jgi:murein DD-endopeptidase MepM/ murein hydrolase activator NlpD
MKSFRFILVPEDSGAPKQFRLTQKMIRIFVGVGIFFVLANLSLVVWNVWHLGGSFKSVYLLEEKTKLQGQVSFLQEKFDSLSGHLTAISEKNKALYLTEGIPEPEHNYAVGGPQMQTPTSNYIPTSAAFKIDSLLFVARQESKALSAVEFEFSKRENLLRHTPSILPLQGNFSSGFAKRIDPFTGTWKMHEGMDIRAPKGTPVKCTADGRVAFVGWDFGYGKVVLIDHIWFQTKYCHLDEYRVTVGQKVERGDIIGTCGRTGRTSGIHLHYEVHVAGKPVDPKDYFLPTTICVD